MSGWTRRRAAAALALVSAAVPAPPAFAAEVPFLAGRVNDYADLVAPEAEERLEGRLAAFERQRGAQIAVLTIPSLAGEPIEDFTLRVAETWGLGREAADDGVLFLVARDDRRMRIEVGYGLEAELTDAESGRILRNVVTPRFQGGDFSGGVEAGVEAIVGALDGSYEPPLEVERPTGGGAGAEQRAGAVVGLLVAAFFSFQTLFTGGLVSWVLFLVLAPFWGAVVSSFLGAGYGPWGIAAWVVLFLLIKLILSTPGGRRWSRSQSARSRPWGTGGGWGGGGGFSGGGFSGGGGSFGGGGASGSW